MICSVSSLLSTADDESMNIVYAVYQPNQPHSYTTIAQPDPRTGMLLQAQLPTLILPRTMIARLFLAFIVSAILSMYYFPSYLLCLPRRPRRAQRAMYRNV
jgi:hypothetical protein